MYTLMHYPCTKSLIHEQDGYTLIETVTAVALLVTVLVPTGALLAHLVTEHQAARQARALMFAETAIEEMILHHAQQDEAPAGRDETHRTWRIVRSSQTQGGLVELRVAVYWKDREAPTVVLQTARE